MHKVLSTGFWQPNRMAKEAYRLQRDTLQSMIQDQSNVPNQIINWIGVTVLLPLD